MSVTGWPLRKRNSGTKQRNFVAVSHLRNESTTRNILKSPSRDYKCSHIERHGSANFKLQHVEKDLIEDFQSNLEGQCLSCFAKVRNFFPKKGKRLYGVYTFGPAANSASEKPSRGPIDRHSQESHCGTVAAKNLYLKVKLPASQMRALR